ncbi:MAG: antitoxin family protein [Chloroflexi bacterium]|nr:antitoxin family protein [Chloroflexota bacterium]
MLSTVRAIVRNGKIELLEPVDLAEGAQVLVTVLTDEEQVFWQAASAPSLDQVWENDEDDIYAKLLPV